MILHGIWLAVLGVLAASNLIIAKKPEARELIAKIAPYQGWIGALSVLGGIWGLIVSITSLSWFTHFPVRWILMLADAVLLVALGLLLGVGVLKTFIKNPTAQAKMDETIAKLAPKQGMLGLVAIGVGILYVVFSII